MRRIAFILAAVLLVGVAAAAQDMRPVGYLAEFQIQPAHESKFVELVKKYDKPVFDRLISEGAVLAWGLDAKMVHQHGGTTHMLWWVTPDFSGMDKVFGEFATMDVAEEDQKTFHEIVDLNKHHDHLVRSIVVRVNESEPEGTVYTAYSFIKVKAGKSSEWQKMFDKYTKPVLDKLMDDGTLFGYGVDVEWIHSEDPGWRAIWIVSTSLAAFDKLEAAFREARQAHSEEAREAIDHWFQKITESGEHRDSLWRSVSLESASE